jgi:hypothetical protein
MLIHQYISLDAVHTLDTESIIKPPRGSDILSTPTPPLVSEIPRYVMNGEGVIKQPI